MIEVEHVVAVADLKVEAAMDLLVEMEVPIVIVVKDVVQWADADVDVEVEAATNSLEMEVVMVMVEDVVAGTDMGVEVVSSSNPLVDSMSLVQNRSEKSVLII